MIESHSNHWAVDRYPTKFLPQIGVQRGDVAESAQNFWRRSIEAEAIEQVVRAVSASRADNRSACPSQRSRLSVRYNATLPSRQKSRVSREPHRDPTSAYSQASPTRRIRFSHAPLPRDSRARERGSRRQIAARAASEVGACGAIENKEFSEASPEARRGAFAFG